MEMRDNAPKNIFERMRVMQSCPMCNTEYKNGGVRVAQEDGGASLVHVSCSNCCGSLMAIVVESGVGVSSVGMITDMSYDDLVRFHNEAPVSADDCLHLHTLLNQPSVFINALGKDHYGIPIKSKASSRKG